MAQQDPARLVAVNAVSTDSHDALQSRLDRIVQAG
jgi:hypothetical protein